MSAETLKFFEDKSTESIINWMMNHLTEEQIRMCLDQSTIPDSSLVAPSAPPAASASSAAAASSAASAMLPSEPLGSPPQDQPPATVPKKSATDLFTDKYRRKCYGTQYLIKQVTKEGVEYYEFKEVEEEDISKNPSLKIGDVDWVFNKEPISTFKNYCTEEDKEVLELLKEENIEKFMNAPDEVMLVAADYIRSGLVSPIPALAVPLEEPLPTPVQPQVQLTEPMIKAIKIQQTTSDSIRQEYPDLYSRGITMYPIFVYGSEGEKVRHLSVAVKDGKITFEEDLTNQRLLNSKFKKVINALQSSIVSGLYNPTDNIREEMNQALRTVNPEIPQKIKVIYDPVNVAGYTFFGTLSDSDMSEIDAEEVKDYEDITPQMKKIYISKKKPSEMSQTELENWVIDTRGQQYLNEYEPIIYTNAIGIKNVKFVKRETPLKKDDSFEEVKYTPFMAPQGGRDINAGSGSLRMKYDSDDELLF